MSPRIPPALRRRVAEEAGHRCGYCLTPEGLSGARLELDHILPRAAGGETAEENLWLACAACNRFKGTQTHGRDPETGRRVRRSAYLFPFSALGAPEAFLEGLTAVGAEAGGPTERTQPPPAARAAAWRVGKEAPLQAATQPEQQPQGPYRDEQGGQTRQFPTVSTLPENPAHKSAGTGVGLPARDQHAAFMTSQGQAPAEGPTSRKRRRRTRKRENLLPRWRCAPGSPLRRFRPRVSV